MTVDEVLALDVDELAPLQSPVLLIGLTGWFDVAGAATAALAEITWGVARGRKDVAYIYSASGIGAGLVLNGALYLGANGTAGHPIGIDGR